MHTIGQRYGQELTGIYRERTPHTVRVQYRHEPHCAPGMRIAFHYGRGVPIRYAWLPAMRTSAEESAERLAQMIRDADNGIAPDSVHALAPLYL